MSIRVVCDNKIPFLHGVLESAGVEVDYLSGSEITPASVKDASALIVRTRTKCNAELLANSKVKFIATATIGFDHLDIDYLKSRNIVWTNAPGCNAFSVVQYVMSVLMSRNIVSGTLGIIGVGNVGGRLAKVAESLGFKVLLNDPPRAEIEGSQNFVDLDTLLSQSDVVTTHVPLTPLTREMANGDFFAKMKPSALYINSSRGEVVNEASLKEALKAKSINSAVLDVWQNEPNIDLELLDLVDIATMHIAGYSQDGKANATTQSVQSLAKFFDIAELKDFQVTQLPPPQEAKIELKKEHQIQQAILHTYMVVDDDKLLRAEVGNFEKLRGSYRIRREFPAYKISGGTAESNQILEAVGFKI